MIAKAECYYMRFAHVGIESTVGDRCEHVDHEYRGEQNIQWTRAARRRRAPVLGSPAGWSFGGGAKESFGVGNKDGYSDWSRVIEVTR